MDPLSAAASVAGLVGLTLEASRTMSSYCKSVKDAHKDVREIAQELVSMYDVLYQLDELLRSQQLKTRVFESTSVLASAITICGKSINKISSKVHRLELGGLARVWENLKWPFSEKETQKLLGTLQRCAATFQFSLTIEGCTILSRTSKDATQSLQTQLETAERVLQLTRDVGTLAESAKEAFKVSNQISEVLEFVTDYTTTLETVQSISRGISALAARSQESRKMDVLSWLSSHRYSHLHHDVRARRMPGTGQWLLEHENFNTWMEQGNPVLWCSGGPGAGKSVLTSLVIDRILENHLTPHEAIAYFYFDYRDQQVQTPAYFLASLLRQLAARRNPLPQALLDFYDGFKEEQPQNLISELHEAFRMTFEAYEKCFIMIDAFDECKDEAHRAEIIRVLGGLPIEKSKIFVTSRPHTHDIKEYLKDALQVDVEASETDIKHYCSRMIDQRTNATDLISGSLRQQVVNSIASMAHGMFLLPVLQLQGVLEAMTKSEVRASLNNLSPNLGQAFENTIQRIENEPPNRRQVATRALMWVSHARRPLKINELCHALATNLGDREFDQDNLVVPPRSVIECCYGLMVLDDEGSTVRLVHYTLQDHLQSRRPQSFQQEETEITKVLITYVCLDETAHVTSELETEESGVSNINRSLLLQSSFLQYAAANWGHHAKLSLPSEINELAIVFLDNIPKLTRATTEGPTPSLTDGLGHIRHREPWESRHRSKRTGLHVVAEFGLVELLKLLLDRGLDVNAEDSYYNTALHDASIYGQSDALKLLLDRGADVNAKNIDRNTPLYLAVSFSREELLPTLLKQGADVDRLCKDDWSPLHKAADNGHVAIAQMLLGHGASVTGRSLRGLIPLHRAAGRGHIQMVQLFLNHGSPVDESTWDGWTPLHGASSSGQDEAVKLLLEHGADINIQSEEKCTALHRACRGGHYDVASRLLTGNAQPLVRDCNGNIPLHRAAKAGHERISTLLLQQTSVSPLTQLSALNVRGRKPEKEASSSGHWRVATLLRREELLQKGMAIEEQDQLELAIEAGHFARVMELLSNGANVNRINSVSLTPLHQALFAGNDAIARTLLEHHADVTMATSDGWQPLHCAASKGMASILYRCLDHKADIAARTLDGQTALHNACKSGSVETVQVLLDLGADIEAKDDSGRRPLHIAASAGFQDIVELLIAHNAEMKAIDRELRSVQDCAAMAGKHALVEYLRQARQLDIDSLNLDYPGLT